MYELYTFVHTTVQNIGYLLDLNCTFNIQSISKNTKKHLTERYKELIGNLIVVFSIQGYFRLIVGSLYINSANIATFC